MTGDVLQHKIPTIPAGKRRIGPGEPVFVIAEIGINHEGSFEVCARMVEEAAKAGADAIKLQTIDADENYVPGTESHTLFKQAWLSHEETARIFELARECGIEPFTTAGDFRTLDFVDSLEPAAHKISSGLLTHTPLIRHATKTGRSLLISTGMNDLAAIDAAVAAAEIPGRPNVALFQCTSVYPAPPETLNLAAVAALEERFRVPCGFSDHSEGIEAAMLSVAAGARLIEKHFTLDRTRPSYDHRLSLEPEAFARMVDGVRRAEQVMGSPQKSLDDRERESARRFLRCLVARREIHAGDRLDDQNVAVMRVMPGKQVLPPSALDMVLGSRAANDITQFTPISSNDIATRAEDKPVNA